MLHIVTQPFDSTGMLMRDICKLLQINTYTVDQNQTDNSYFSHHGDAGMERIQLVYEYTVPDTVHYFVFHQLIANDTNVSNKNRTVLQ